MVSNEKLVEQAAAYKTDARRLFEEAVAALIALAFRYPQLGANFLWDANPNLDEQANSILRRLSERARDAAKRRALAVIAEADLADGEYAWDATDGLGDEPMLERLDMVGSHLRDLLEIWIALAFVEKMTQSYLKISVLRYLANPYAAPSWSRLPAGLLKWGRGYQKDLIAQIALIGQDSIVSSVRFAEWSDAVKRGAKYYIRHRASNFYCPECDAVCEIKFPIEQFDGQIHPRCCCTYEYIYE